MSRSGVSERKQCEPVTSNCMSMQYLELTKHSASEKQGQHSGDGVRSIPLYGKGWLKSERLTSTQNSPKVSQHKY